MGKLIYCIDTSSLIHFRINYPPINFPSVWSNLKNLVKEGRLISPSEVFQEIEDEELKDWCKVNKNMFKNPRNKYKAVKEIIKVSPFLVEEKKDSYRQADPYLIVLVNKEIGKNRQRISGYTNPPNFIIVTQESKTKMKIPMACRRYNIQCIDVLELIQKENWKI